MGLIERLNELESMRQSGQISDSEYAMLVAGATKKFSEIPESLKPDTSESVLEIPQTHSQSKTSSANPKLFGIGLITVLIIAFLVFGRGGSGDKPSAPETQVLKTAKTDAVSDDVKFRKPRLKIHLERFQSTKEYFVSQKHESEIIGGRTLLLIRSNARHVFGLTISASQDVTRAFEEFPELAGEGNAVNQILSLFGEIYLSGVVNTSNMQDARTGLIRAGEMWPTVIDAMFQWENTLQKLIDESP